MAIVNLNCGGGGRYKNTLTALIDRSITEIEILYGIKTVGAHAFDSCRTVQKITIPDSVTLIGTAAFSAVGDKVGIEEVVIPDSVTKIEANAFIYSGIKKFIVSKNITSFPSGVFQGNSQCVYYDLTRHETIPTLENVNVFKNINADCKIYVPKSLYDEWIVATNWAEYADYIVGVRGENDVSEGLEMTLLTDGTGYEVVGIGECTDTDVVIPSEYEGLPVTHIGPGAFYNCSGITSITIPDSVLYIYSEAFGNCTGLTSIFIPSSVTWTAFSVFAGCSSITLYDFSTHESPPTIEIGTFDVSAEGVKIKVPKGKLAEWQSATNWCEYASYMVEAE